MRTNSTPPQMLREQAEGLSKSASDGRQYALELIEKAGAIIARAKRDDNSAADCRAAADALEANATSPIDESGSGAGFQVFEIDLSSLFGIGIGNCGNPDCPIHGGSN